MTFGALAKNVLWRKTYVSQGSEAGPRRDGRLTR